MSAVAAEYIDEAFSFIERLDHLKTTSQVIDSMAQSLALFGFEHFVVTGLPSHRERFEQRVVLRKWPPGWFELYNRKDFVHVDPVIRFCRGTVQPFEWDEAPYDPEREPRAKEVMNRAADFGMRRGFCLPIHGLHGYEACFSMSGSHLDLDGRTKPAIHLMAMYAFERVRQIDCKAKCGSGNPLTGREQEVLRWAADGKSAAEISSILEITVRTVTAHTVNAMRKLKATNKTQAVASALQHRLIRL